MSGQLTFGSGITYYRRRNLQELSRRPYPSVGLSLFQPPSFNRHLYRRFMSHGCNTNGRHRHGATTKPRSVSSGFGGTDRRHARDKGTRISSQRDHLARWPGLVWKTGTGATCGCAESLSGGTAGKRGVQRVECSGCWDQRKIVDGDFGQD